MMDMWYIKCIKSIFWFEDLQKNKNILYLFEGIISQRSTSPLCTINESLPPSGYMLYVATGPSWDKYQINLHIISIYWCIGSMSIGPGPLLKSLQYRSHMSLLGAQVHDLCWSCWIRNIVQWGITINYNNNKLNLYITFLNTVTRCFKS